MKFNIYFRQNLLLNLHDKIKSFRSIKSKVHDFSSNDQLKSKPLHKKERVIIENVKDRPEQRVHNSSKYDIEDKQSNFSYEEIPARNNTDTNNDNSSSGHPGEVIEIVKFSSELDTIEEESVDTNSTPIDNSIDDSINQQTDKDPAKILDPDTTHVTDLVKNFIKNTLPKKLKFDPQDLLFRIKNNYYLRNVTWETDYKLLTCKAQPFSQRISLLGEFYN